MNYPEYTVFPASGELGRYDAMKLSGYQHLICAGAECDLSTRGMSIRETIANSFAWAMTSLTIDVVSPITGCEPLTVRTWPSGIRSAVCRRELEFIANGGLCFSAAVFSVPVDTATRKIVPPESLMIPGVAGEPVVKDAVSRISGVPDVWDILTKKVCPSDIDALGHMNNCRYGAFVYDALTDDEREALTKPFRYTINFRRQLMEGDECVISRAREGSVLYVTGRAADSEKNAFVAMIEYPNA